MESGSRFFIVGCQRSGTTLMRLVLECHSEIECLDEGRAYAALSDGGAAPRQRRWLGLKVPVITEQLADATLHDPVGFGRMPNPYRGEPILYLTRDVRDTVASMQSLQVDGRAWIDGWLTPTLDAKRAHDVTFATRYRAELSAIDQATDRELARAAFYWRYKTEALFDYRAQRLPVLLVRYEDLVTGPRAALRRVCEFLGVGFEPALLAHARTPHPQVDEQGVAVGGTRAGRSINDLSIGRWRRTFTDDQAAALLHFAGPRHAQLYP